MRKYPLSVSDNRLTLDADRILANDVIVPGETNPHKVGLWLIESVYGPLGAVWADNEADALDEAADEELLDALSLSEEDAEERTTGIGDDTEEDFARLGNDSSPFDLDNANIRRLAWTDIPKETQEALLLAREEGLEDLSEIEDLDDDDNEDDSED